MAGLFSTTRPTIFWSPSSSSSSSSSSQSSSSSSSSNFAARLVYLLTVISVSLGVFAFILQWRGGLPDPNARWLNEYGPREFPVTADLSKSVRVSSSSGVVDLLGQSRTSSFPYFRNWKFNIGSSSGSDLKPKGKAASPEASKVLQSITGVRVIHRTKELENIQAKSRIWNETWLAGFFFQPCNYELFVKQTLNMEMAIVMAREAGVEWIIHLDTDELLHPAGSSEYSLRRLLGDLPKDVDMVIFPNHESSVERDDVKEPFSEVSLFKKSFDHLPREVYYANYKDAAHNNPNYFLTYGNGKSAARIRDHLRPNGAHRWHNYMTNPKEIKMEDAAVLHYTYPKFSDLTSRRDRCGCKPTKEDVKRCFMLDFDRSAFIIASTLSEKEMLHWYREHIVWTDKKVIHKLTKNGILMRIYTPMTIIQGLKESGVFASAIALAQRDIVKEESLSSTGNRNASGNPHITDTFPRKMGRTLESEATRRKVLEYNETDHHPAIPPESPPSPYDNTF